MKKLKQAFSPLLIALSMYTRVPMPQLEWTASGMAYAMGCFPAAGVLAGGAQALFLLLCRETGIFGPTLRAAMMLALPLVISGGIHLDGLCDVCDATASHKPREERLRILKDSHCGAFAVIGCCLWFLLSFAAWRDVDLMSPGAYALCLVPVLSRSLSGLAAACFRNARGSGQLAAFTDAANRRAVRALLVVWLCLSVVGMALLGGAWLQIFAAAAAVFAVFSLWAHKSYGGFTGDLCGCMLELTELACIAAAVM